MRRRNVSCLFVLSAVYRIRPRTSTRAHSPRDTIDCFRSINRAYIKRSGLDFNSVLSLDQRYRTDSVYCIDVSFLQRGSCVPKQNKKTLSKRMLLVVVYLPCTPDYYWPSPGYSPASVVVRGNIALPQYNVFFWIILILNFFLFFLQHSFTF